MYTHIIISTSATKMVQRIEKYNVHNYTFSATTSLDSSDILTSSKYTTHLRLRQFLLRVKFSPTNLLLYYTKKNLYIPVRNIFNIFNTTKRTQHALACIAISLTAFGINSCVDTKQSAWSHFIKSSKDDWAVWGRRCANPTNEPRTRKLPEHAFTITL